METSTSIRNALGLLEYIGLGGERSFAQIAEHAELPKSTLHRLLNVLIDEGFVTRSRFNAYRCSLKLWRIGAAVTNYDSVRENVLPVLRQLVDTTSETALYVVYEGGWCVYVAKVEATNPIRAGTSIGSRAPAHASASGKAILSWRDKAEIVRVVRSGPRYTPDTCTDPKKFLKIAEEVRRNGYSVSRGEWHAGLWGIAAPIFHPSGEVDAAVSITGPAASFRENFDRYVEAVIRAGEKLSLIEDPERRRIAGSSVPRLARLRPSHDDAPETL